MNPRNPRKPVPGGQTQKMALRMSASVCSTFLTPRSEPGKGSLAHESSISYRRRWPAGASIHNHRPSRVPS